MIYSTSGTTQAIQFPGGEEHVNITGAMDQYEVVAIRDGSASSLVQAAEVSLLRAKRGLPTSLVAAYLPGARQDKHLEVEGALFASIINAGRFQSVWVLDPHSDAIVSRINAHIVRHPIGYTVDFARTVGADLVVAPDAGATQRADLIASALDIPMMVAHKTRGENGRITSYSVPPYDGPEPTSILAVDDICDGGGTFNYLADILSERFPRATRSLWVTHGVFSQGVEAVSGPERYAAIGTTDSHIGAGEQVFDKIRTNLLSDGTTVYVYRALDDLMRSAMENLGYQFNHRRMPW